MSTSDICRKDGESTKSNNNDACDVTLSQCELEEKLQKMSTDDNGDVLLTSSTICANCGKEGAKNICNKCKQVKYCNAVCKKVHKKKHKKDCEEYIRLAAEKHNEEARIAAELHDKELFKQPPPLEDCPICFLQVPTLDSGRKYNPCCGKRICSGCDYAPVYDNQGNEVAEKKCPYCRTSAFKSEKEAIEREKKRVKVDDPMAINNLGIRYRDGTNGYPQDYRKALELWHRAGELGHAMAYSNIGYAYHCGQGVKVDVKKARHYYELAAIGGDVDARHSLGFIEMKACNMNKALKHWIIAIRGGFTESLENVKRLYSAGYATKEDYTKALQAYQEYLGEIKSVQRDKAATADEEYRYY